jgi:SAM-dependent methyltransferase
MMANVLHGISSIRDVSPESEVSIYNLDIEGCLHKVLYGHPSYVCSDYLPAIKGGTQIKDQTYCQNVEALTFEDERFDLVISEDVFEHVRNCDKGFREIYRVLKRGGYHIFTIPCYFDRKTLMRVDTSGPEDVLILPEYHEDKIRGKMLAYRTFGIDIFDTLKGIGFSVSVGRSDYSDLKSGIVDSYVFVAKK